MTPIALVQPFGGLGPELVTVKPEDIVPTTRWVTGGYYRHAYALNRHLGKFLIGCRHKHRSAAMAEVCAVKLVKKARLSFQ